MADSQYRHVFVVPWCGEGHITGMLRLALLLAGHKGLLVSFGYPARAHALAVKRNKLAHLPPSLRVHVVEDGLSSVDCEAPTFQQFINSPPVIADALEALFRRLMAASSAADGTPLRRQLDHHIDAAVAGAYEIASSSSWPPICCIISDTFLPATQVLADNLGVPRVDFWTGNATVYNIFLHVPQLLAKGVLPLCKEGAGEEWKKAEAPLIDFIPGLPPCRVSQLPWDLLQKYEVTQPMVEFLQRAFARAKDGDRIVVHSVYELEKHVYDAMQARGFPIYSIGPIFEATSDTKINGSEARSEVAANRSEAKSDLAASRSECLDWLGQQKQASVVYVAFGTMSGLAAQELLSMALGLEASGHPFLWVVPTGSITNSTESFMKGFMQQNTVSAHGRGVIVPWVPQMEVLKHPAVGAFISHCGWNSVLESLWEGVPIVACPQVAEQNCNAKSVVEDWKVGVEMEREDDGGFTKEAVRRAIEEIMGNREVKERALHLKQVVRHAISPEGSSHSNLVSLVDYLLHLPAARRCS